MILLDTNILSEALRDKPDRKVQARLNNHAGNFAASVVTLNELRYGAMLHSQPKSFWLKIETKALPLVDWLKVDKAIALRAADVRADLRRKGQTGATNDCLIAATALVHGVLLVTRNIQHFEGIPDLSLENWFE